MVVIKIAKPGELNGPLPSLTCSISDPNLGTLIIYSYWVSYLPLYRQKPQLIWVEPAAHTPSRFKLRFY